tara:strand:+ start:327 stop:617 length:291 start_codon:yes stop_codon:yes gene_type:complete
LGLNRLKELINYKGHLTQTRFFKPKNKASYFHLNDLNIVWKNYFGIDYSDKPILNKTNFDTNSNSFKAKLEFDNNQMKLIKSKFYYEYEFVSSKLS